MDYIETLKQKFADLKAALCIPGGSNQKNDLLYTAFDKKILTPREMLSMISNLYEEKEKTLSEGGILPVSMFNFGKEHHVYPVLDKSGKFCMKHYGEDEWEDVAYVFWVMDVDKAWEIYETFDRDETSDNLPADEDEWTQDNFFAASGEERFRHYARICNSNNFVPVNWKDCRKTKTKWLTDIWNQNYKPDQKIVYICFDNGTWYTNVYVRDVQERQPMYTSLEDLLDDSSAFFIGDCQIK